jgi:23S rRNA (cytidine2498-2'-O)-methyltransferase
MEDPAMTSPLPPPRFLFITCQVGAEAVVKEEIAQRWPDFHIGYARPGFLTYKLPEGKYLAADFRLGSVFARAYGFSLGNASLDDASAAAQEAWKLLGDRPVSRIHVWERDRWEPGELGFTPCITPRAVAAYEALKTACLNPERLAGGNHLTEAAAAGELIADVILVEGNQWWVGYHRARGVPSRWPGGIMDLHAPPGVVSRAWLKMEEALAWAQLPASKGARFAELGSSPGGASQALLERGFEVIGIDPAEMAEEVSNHPHFRHIRRRVVQVPRRAFRKVRWLTADMNVAPAFTLDAVEAIVRHREVNIRGMLLTLKLPEWKLASEVPSYLMRIRSWGYNLVQARQLAHNRHEVCIAALQRPFLRKPLVKN